MSLAEKSAGYSGLKVDVDAKSPTYGKYVKPMEAWSPEGTQEPCSGCSNTMIATRIPSYLNDQLSRQQEKLQSILQKTLN